MKAMQTKTAIAPTAPAAAPFFHRIWPPAIIACALALTAAWVAVLGYGLVRIVGLAL